ncbi:hypothetical protein GCM10017083_54930 [Thalassobaculum fulvum]|jgi:hypothetical protein|uniref:Uncharacterized protein n=2 Tax=Thalassobaculum fulvum TaxID=1633335 RepID=A0A919CU30_9PROT|nr:hypothetical protein GCM10017083_54930 [Thalassobaculum fulvum]
MTERHDSGRRLHYLFEVGQASDGASMTEIDARDRQALGLLSETVTAELGPASVVAREVNRAYRSGRQADLRTASAAFDALPGWQRSRIGGDAARRAKRLKSRLLQGTARDWRDLPGGEERITIPSPPRFLRPKPQR